MNKEQISFAMDELDYLMAKVARVHGDHHPELNGIKECYLNIKEAMKENNEGAVRESLRKAYTLSNGFTLPEDACQAYTRVYKAFSILTEEYKLGEYA